MIKYNRRTVICPQRAELAKPPTGGFFSFPKETEPVGEGSTVRKYVENRRQNRGRARQARAKASAVRRIFGSANERQDVPQKNGGSNDYSKKESIDSFARTCLCIRHRVRRGHARRKRHGTCRRGPFRGHGADQCVHYGPRAERRRDGVPAPVRQLLSCIQRHDDKDHRGAGGCVGQPVPERQDHHLHGGRELPLSRIRGEGRIHDGHRLRG